MAIRPSAGLEMLASVIVDGERRAAIVVGDRVGITGLPGLDVAIEQGIDVLGAVREWREVTTVRFDAPIRPPVVFCLGQTYASHLRENGIPGFDPDVRPDAPEFFIKAGQTIVAPDEMLAYDPSSIAKLDYETELGVVIGRRTSDVAPEAALESVLGYVVVNDLTARERQVRFLPDGTRRMAPDAAKNFDGATRIGCGIVPARDVARLDELELSTTVNGELRQLDRIGNLLFGVAEQVSWLSRLMTLRPGALIATGTPGGTGWSVDRELGGTGVVPPGCTTARYLTAGDRVLSRVAGIGELTFEVEHRRPPSGESASGLDVVGHPVGP
jgi:2-keto-4-pentenoate hydratase/2-oxohepta-3-ene-1,7-dioic acid hydratase in catechol pathway